MGLVKDEPDSGSEACVATVNDGTEEGDVKVEDTLDIKEKHSEELTFPKIKPERCEISSNIARQKHESLQHYEGLQGYCT
jgi:hypothetical protein